MENDSKQHVSTRTQAEAPAPAPDDAVTVATPVQTGPSSQPLPPSTPSTPSTPSAPSASSDPAAPSMASASTSGSSSSTPPPADPASALPHPASSADPASPSAADALNAAGAPDASASPNGVVAGTAPPAAGDGQASPVPDALSAPVSTASSKPSGQDAQQQPDLPTPAQPASWHTPAAAHRDQSFLPYPGAAPVPGQMPGQFPGQVPSHVPWEAASSWGATTLTITANTAAGASYLFWWLSGMLIYFNERHNRFVRFHAMQSILLTGAMTVFAVLAYILSSLCGDLYQVTGLHAYRTLGTGIAALAVVLIVIPWLWAMIAAWSGNYMRLPIVGTYAERYSAPPLHPPTVF